MSLFHIPKREDVNISTILTKINQAPKIPTGVSIAEELERIDRDVEKALGNESRGFRCLDTKDKLLEYCNKAREDGIVAVDCETTGIDSMLDDLVGVCLYSPSQSPAYIPVGHINAVTFEKEVGQVSMEDLAEGLKLLKNCVFHNGYFDIVFLYNSTGVMLEDYWDTLIAGHLLDENESHSLKDLYAKYILNNEVDAHYFNELFGKVPFCYIPYQTAMKYAAKDAKMTYELMKFQERFLTPGTEECREYGLEKLGKFYKEEIMPMLPVLIDMKLTGMEFDFNEAAKLKEKYEKLKYNAIIAFNQSLEPYKKEILNCGIEYPLNYNSPAQIKVLFYDIAKIGVVYRKEPTGTGNNVLDSILALDKFKNNPIRNVAKCIKEVKAYDKVISSFIDKLTNDARLHNGIIHSDLKLEGTVTGRLASANPK